MNKKQLKKRVKKLEKQRDALRELAKLKSMLSQAREEQRQRSLTVPYPRPCPSVVSYLSCGCPVMRLIDGTLASACHCRPAAIRRYWDGTRWCYPYPCYPISNAEMRASLDRVDFYRRYGYWPC